METSQNNSTSKLCKDLLENPVCRDVPEHHKMTCDNRKQNGFLSKVVWGCWNYSTKEILIGIWNLLKWIWSNVEDSTVRGETMNMAGRAIDSVQLYLNAEFEKAYEEEKSTVKAVSAVANSLGKMLYRSIAKKLSTELKEWSCFNTEGKSGKICDYITAFAGGGISVNMLRRLWRKDLRFADFSNKDFSLRSSKWKGRDLQTVNFTNANIPNANFKKSNLSSSNFTSANLSNANFNQANLMKADLKNANLREAVFEESNLSSANLSNTDLRKANLQAANLEYADLTNANLTGAFYNRKTKFPKGFNPNANGMKEWHTLAKAIWWRLPYRPRPRS